MKAYVLHGVNDLRYEDCEIPKTQSGWCLVKVKAAGICSSDIPRIFSKGTYHFPTIPGHEFSGIVESVASEEDNYWVGKRVGAFPLIPCMKCDQCKQHHYETCLNYGYIGSRRDGAFGEYVAVPCWNLIEVPENVSFIHAAMLEPLSVALHATKLAGNLEGRSFAVIGTGMIGFAVAQWAKRAGAFSVTVIGRSNHKRNIADQIKVNYIDKKSEEINQKFDVVLEATGHNSSIEKSIELASPGGDVILMGNPYGDIAFPQNVYWQILRKQLTLKGTWNSSYESGSPCDWSEVVKAIDSKDIILDPLVSHTYFQETLAYGLDVMKNHTENYCKIITIWNK